MNSIVLVIHLILAIALVCAVLLQKSEGGALGMGGGGGGGGGMGGFMTGRGAADLLTRTPAILAACFMATSMILAILAADTRTQGSILDKPQAAPSAPVKPTGPSVPLAY